MTKYILVGGYPRSSEDFGSAFYQELVEGHQEPVKLLICEFARDDDWKALFEHDCEIIQEQLPHAKIEFKLATEDGFADEAKWADTIYFKGGHSLKLLRRLTRALPVPLEAWRQLFDGKTVAGTSAGANILAEYFYGLSAGTVREGLGLVPIKVLVHYDSNYKGPGFDWQQAVDALESHGPKLPVMKLKEGEYQVVKQ